MLPWSLTHCCLVMPYDIVAIDNTSIQFVVKTVLDNMLANFMKKQQDDIVIPGSCVQWVSSVIWTPPPTPRGQSSVVGGLKWWLLCKRPFHREAQIWVKQYLA